MSFNIDWVIVPIVGSIIGLFTNWLAIKMIFRPFEERKIFGIRLPFTPGIMPKRRYILSNKIGATVSTHILTKEVLGQELITKESMNGIKSDVHKIFEGIKTSDKTLEDLLSNLPKGNKDNFLCIAEKFLQNSISDILKSQYVIDEISHILSIEIENILKKESLAIDIAGFLENHKDEMILRYNQLLQSDEYKKFKTQYLSNIVGSLKENDKKLRDYIPEDIVELLKQYIAGWTPDLSQKIEHFLISNPELEKKLDESVQKIAKDNISKMAIMFVSKEKIYQSIKKEALEYLKSPINQIEINLKINNEIDKFLDKNVKEILVLAPKDLEMQPIMDTLLNESFAGFALDAIIKKLSETNFSLQGFIENYLPTIQIKAQVYLKENLAFFMENKISVIANEQIGHFTSVLLMKKASSFFTNMPESEVSQLEADFCELLEYGLLEGMGYISGAIDISTVVEEQINKFDLEDAEKIIISVANKELKAVTYFGGLLGFIMGLLTVMFQSIINF